MRHKNYNPARKASTPKSNLYLGAFSNPIKLAKKSANENSYYY
jgi:hypothetical protein